MKTIVAAARNETHGLESVTRALRGVLDHLDPPLSSLIKRGDRVLVKVNMGCSGFRDPNDRLTSHPAYVEAIIQALKDCGARVMFGDDVARTARYERIWQVTGMQDVAARTGATLVDFMAAGGREVRGCLLYPRTYLVTNLAFQADAIVNAANCRSLTTVVLSGAIKNMFGCVLGTRRWKVHSLLPDPSDFARALVDIYRLVQPRVSFLDLTTVIEGCGVAWAVQPVGLILGSTDAVALDTVAAHAIGYEDLTLWTGVHGKAMGLGCNRMDQITVRGLDWEAFEKKGLRYPELPVRFEEPLYDRATRFLNNTILRPRPVIATAACTGCGDCRSRCPVGAIHSTAKGRFSIDHKACADCGCCLRICEVQAVQKTFVGLAKVVRGLAASVSAARTPVSTGSQGPLR